MIAEQALVHVRDNIYRAPYKRKNGKSSNIYYVKRPCYRCGVETFQNKRNERAGSNAFCSKTCYLAGKHKPDGSTKRKRGFGTGPILIKQLHHPYARKGWVPEHRLVMEQQLGRLLEPTEVVHHINMVQDDNRPENLYLCKTNQEHFLCHGSLNKCVATLIERGVVIFENGGYRV